MPDRPRKRRDVTRALAIVVRIKRRVPATDLRTHNALNELAVILQTIDARTGRRDPSKRPARR